MGASYLIRFDDICPTMNWKVWAEVERALAESGVKPVLGVIPDNKDPKLDVSPPDPLFWERVRGWRDRGWTVGLHGYQHDYVTGEAGLVGLNRYSEFAGLPAEEQGLKLRLAVDIFSSQGVSPAVWIAPAHSFDLNTVLMLKGVGIGAISDGLYLYPHMDSHGMLWVPQQLWGLRPLPFGVWTVCYHTNSWSPEDISRFRTDLKRFKDSISGFDEVVSAYGSRRRRWSDPAISKLLLASIRLKGGCRRRVS